MLLCVKISHWVWFADLCEISMPRNSSGLNTAIQREEGRNLREARGSIGEEMTIGEEARCGKTDYSEG